MQGQRLADTILGDFPLPYDDMPPGAYWKVLSRKTGMPMDMNNPEDRAYWASGTDERWKQNLTGGVWGYISPNGLYGMMSIHTVREESDGTISVRPGDGSSNSILISIEYTNHPELNKSWHGYIEHGVWSEC